MLGFLINFLYTSNVYTFLCQYGMYVHRICSIVHFSPENSETQTPYQIFIEAIHIRVYLCT